MSDQEQDRSQHDPFAPSAAAEPAPSFPEERLRRLGADDDDVAMSRETFDAMTPDEKRDALEALAALSDDELAEAIVESRDGRGQVDPDWTVLEEHGGPTEAERVAAHAALVEGGLSDAEARGTVWPAVEPQEPADGSGSAETQDGSPEGVSDGEGSLTGDGATAEQRDAAQADGAEVATGGPGEADAAPGSNPGADPSEPTQGEQLIAGKTDDVLDRVGDDADLARFALDAELVKGDRQRKGLVAGLEKVVGAAGRD